MERADELALLMTREMGKPIAESKAEIAYAAECFRWFAGEATRIQDRHAQYFLELSEKAFASLRSSESDLWVRRLDLERGNVTATLDFLSSRRDARFIRMVSALSRYWIRGRVRDGYVWTERAMRSADPTTTTDLALLEGWAWLTWQSARSGPAFDAMDEMLKRALAVGDDAMAGRALNMIATFRNSSGLEVDPDLWTRAEGHLRRAGEDWPLALLLNDMGWVTSMQGNPAAGLPRISEALEVARRAGDRWLIALILDSVAWAQIELGEVERAVEAWSEGISLTVAAADRLFGQAGGRLADELAVHHRNAPVMAAVEALGNLPAVAEIAQRIAEPQGFRAVEARIACGPGTGEHALRHPALQLLL